MRAKAVNALMPGVTGIGLAFTAPEFLAKPTVTPFRFAQDSKTGRRDQVDFPGERKQRRCRAFLPFQLDLAESLAIRSDDLTCPVPFPTARSGWR